MKKNVLLLPLFMLSSMPTLAGQIDSIAAEGVTYPEIVIKYAKKFPQVRSGEKVIGAEIADPDGAMQAPEKMFNGIAQTRSGDDSSDPQGLQRYYRITLPAEKQKDIKYINALLESVAQLPQVEIVYPASAPFVQKDSGTRSSNKALNKARINADADPLDSTPDFTDRQGYLNDPAVPGPGYFMGGINWQNVKQYPGAQGEGITIISNEVGHWNTQHVDLPPSYHDFTILMYIADENGGIGQWIKDYVPPFDFHDSASVGIMGGKDNGFGITGIANKARFGYAGPTPEGLVKAGAALQPGDVIQLGLQYEGGLCSTTDCGTGFLPMEAQQAWFDAIKRLTDKGIIVIEAAGNGHVNFDADRFNGKFDIAKRDSGAILVGAFCAKSGKVASFSNYGKRVNSSSWGCDDVFTATMHDERVFYNGGPDNQYTASFAGTSAANPIVAGAAASLSGYAKQKNITLTPLQVRTILEETGTRPRATIDRGSIPITVTLPGIDLTPKEQYGVIGTQPDLVKAFQRVDSLQK